MKKRGFQERFFMVLDNSPEFTTVKKILKSPLGLAVEVIRLLFENDFITIKENLDSIKNFVAGINRAENLGKNYKIASYYPYLFSFHQFFHSSYRARQGKVLEELIKEIIRKSNNSIEVADKKDEKKQLMLKVFTNYGSLLDLDVIAKKPKKNVLVIQLRSRDDTGGTTAKASLVEALKDAMSLKIKKGSKLLYLVSIWDEIKSSQKKITIKKLYSSLKPFLGKTTEDYFKKNITKGIRIRGGVTLRLTYGRTELAKSLSAWIGSKEKTTSKKIKEMINRLEGWDDLWLAHALSSIELENLNINNFSNVRYLTNLMKGVKYNLNDFTRNEEFLNLADNLALKIVTKWKKDSIPLNSPSEKVHYIRDLILLKFIYEVSTT